MRVDFVASAPREGARVLEAAAYGMNTEPLTGHVGQEDVAADAAELERARLQPLRAERAAHGARRQVRVACRVGEIHVARHGLCRVELRRPRGYGVAAHGFSPYGARYPGPLER